MQEFKVFFCESHNSADRVVCPFHVAIWPVEPNWNDFGYGFQAEARISYGTETALLVSLLVIPDTNEKNSHRFNLWLNEIKPPDGIKPAHEVGAKFLSIFKSESEYRRLISWTSEKKLNPELILRPLRDLVFFRSTREEHESIALFLNTKAAQNGVFRREPTYLAWHRAGRLLKTTGVSEKEINDAREDFSFEAALPGFGGHHKVRFEFGVPAPLSDRCHALIGKNGVGKSQMLRELVIALGRKIDGTGTDPFISNSTQRGISIDFFPATFRVNRVLVLSWDHRSDFPSAARLDSRFQYLHFTMRDDEFEPQELIPLGSSETLAAQLVQLLREDIAGIGEGFKRLKKSLKPVLNIYDVAVAIKPTGNDIGQKWLSLRHILAANEERQLEIFARLEAGLGIKRWSDNDGPVELSSGERAFLGFGIRCAARMEVGTLLILDEPETHLHPNLVSDLMRVLRITLDDTKSVALVATHSPFIVRELPSRCVHVLRTDNERTPTITSAYLRTFGASVDRLATDIFDDASSAQVNQEVLEEILDSGASFEEIKTLYGRELSPELLSDIRQMMRN